MAVILCNADTFSSRLITHQSLSLSCCYMCVHNSTDGREIPKLTGDEGFRTARCSGQGGWFNIRIVAENKRLYCCARTCARFNITEAVRINRIGSVMLINRKCWSKIITGCFQRKQIAFSRTSLIKFLLLAPVAYFINAADVTIISILFYFAKPRMGQKFSSKNIFFKREKKINKI